MIKLLGYGSIALNLSIAAYSNVQPVKMSPIAERNLKDYIASFPHEVNFLSGGGNGYGTHLIKNNDEAGEHYQRLLRYFAKSKFIVKDLQKKIMELLQQEIEQDPSIISHLYLSPTTQSMQLLRDLGYQDFEVSFLEESAKEIALDVELMKEKYVQSKMVAFPTRIKPKSLIALIKKEDKTKSLKEIVSTKIEKAIAENLSLLDDDQYKLVEPEELVGTVLDVPLVEPIQTKSVKNADSDNQEIAEASDTEEEQVMQSAAAAFEESKMFGDAKAILAENSTESPDVWMPLIRVLKEKIKQELEERKEENLTRNGLLAERIQWIGSRLLNLEFETEGLSLDFLENRWVFIHNKVQRENLYKQVVKAMDNSSLGINENESSAPIESIPPKLTDVKFDFKE